MINDLDQAVRDMYSKLLNHFIKGRIDFGDKITDFSLFFLNCDPEQKIKADVFLYFLNSHLIIAGDFLRGKRPFVSVPGITPELFSSPNLSPDEIGAAFLAPYYDPDQARIDLDDFIAQKSDDGQKWHDAIDQQEAKALSILISIHGDYMFDTQEALRYQLGDLFPEDEPLPFGLRYDSDDLALIIAIQKRFSLVFPLSKLESQNAIN